MEAGTGRKDLRQARHGPHGHSALARTAHGVSSSALRKRSDVSLVRKVPVEPLRPVLANLQEVFLGTKLALLFPAVPLAIAAQCAHFGQVNNRIPSFRVEPDRVLVGFIDENEHKDGVGNQQAGMTFSFALVPS